MEEIVLRKSRCRSVNLIGAAPLDADGLAIGEDAVDLGDFVASGVPILVLVPDATGTFPAETFFAEAASTATAFLATFGLADAALALLASFFFTAIVSKSLLH